MQEQLEELQQGIGVRVINKIMGCQNAGIIITGRKIGAREIGVSVGEL